jgi:hypothetical protein
MMWFQRIYFSGALLLVFLVVMTDLTLWQGLQIAFIAVFLVLPVLTLAEPLWYKFQEWRRNAALKAFIRERVDAALGAERVDTQYQNPFTESFQDTPNTEVLGPEDLAKISQMRSQLNPMVLSQFETIRLVGSSFKKLFLDAGVFTLRMQRSNESAPCNVLMMLPSDKAIRSFKSVWYNRTRPGFSFDLEAKLIPFKTQEYKLLMVTLFTLDNVKLKF